MVNYFKKFFLLFLCIGILPSAYAMENRHQAALIPLKYAVDDQIIELPGVKPPIMSNEVRHQTLNSIWPSLLPFIPLAACGASYLCKKLYENSYLNKKINQYDYTPRGSFHRAEKNGCFSPESLQAIEQSLKKGFINPDFTIVSFGKNRTTPLMVAIQCQEKNLVDLLLKRKVDSNFSYNYKHENSPLSVAIDNILEKSDIKQKQEINYAIFEKLLQNNANVIGNSNGLLLKAVIKQNPKLVNFLLQQKANPNVFNNDGTVLSIVINNIFQEKNIQKQEDNYQILKDLLDHGAKPDCNFATSGSTPLIAAITNKNARIVNLLLKYKADVNMYDFNKHRKTPLSIVINNIIQENDAQKQDDNYTIFKDLLNYKINFDSYITDYGKTALIKAVDNRNIDLINFLLEKNVDVNVFDKNRKTAAYYVIYNILQKEDREINYEILEKLLRYGAKCNFTVGCIELPLIAAIKQDVTLLNLLLKYINTNGIDINACNKDGNTALSIACKAGDFQTVKKLLDNKANPNIKISKTTPLILAIENKNLEMIELLLQCEADVNVADKDGNTPLYFAYKLKKNSKEFNRNELIINLLKRGANPNIKLEYNQTPLTTTVSDQDFEMVELLLKHKADINTSSYGHTPLSTAVEIALENGNNQIVEYLLQHGADPNYIKHAFMPFMMAVQRQNLDMIKLLLKHKANINASSYSGGGEPPLFIAVATDNLEIVKYLLEHGANPNIKNRNSLVKAIQNQNLDMFKLLLQYQIDVNDFCYVNTPLSASIENDNLEAIKILCKAKASLINIKKYDNSSAFHLAISGAFGVNAPRDQAKKCIETLLTYTDFNQELLDKTTKGIELLLSLKNLCFYLPGEIEVRLPEEMRLANLKELYIKLYFTDLQEEYNKIYPSATLKENYDKLYTSAGLKHLYCALVYLKKLNLKDKYFALKTLHNELPIVKDLNISDLTLMSAKQIIDNDQTFNNFIKEAFNNFLKKKFDDFVQQKFVDFVKELRKEMVIIGCRDSILTQVYKRITQLKKILLIQDKQNQTALQLLQINYPHDPAYIYELAPYLDGTKLDSDFNELKEVIIKISNSESKNKLNTAELISLLDSKLPNNLALGIYKNCALLENEKEKN